MSDTFCPMPFVHLNIKQEGRVCACWRHTNSLGNYTEKTLNEIYNSEETIKLRNDLMNGIRAEGCHSCWDMEDSGIVSTGHKVKTDWPELTYENLLQHSENNYVLDIKNLQSIEVRFDNICNLMCRHCSPVYSSKWEVAVKKDEKLYEQLEMYHMVRKNKDQHVMLTDDVIQEVISYAPHLREILITGGEPLYHEKHYDFLESILPWAENITLNYNSNLSVLTYKGKSIIPLWKKFKHVSILVSIDATPDIYEYVRVNGKIETIEKNILKLKTELENVSIQATCTTSLLNITRIVDVMKYYLKLRVGVHTSLVQYPESLNIKLLPNDMKQSLTKEWEDFKTQLPEYLKELYNDSKEINYLTNRVKTVGDSVITYMNSEDRNQKWDNFKNYVNAQDKFNKTSILDFYPEFKEYW